MRRHPGISLPAVAIAIACIGNPVTVAQTPDLHRVLENAAAYLDEYERDVRSVVLEETYLQRVPADGLQRTLRSDLVIVADSEQGWIELRDVVEVDGRGVGGHANRLVGLLSKPIPDALRQARRLADESARFNLNPARGNFQRSVNVPLTALRFLRRSNQARSAWQLDGTERGAGRTVSVLRFDERATPRLIGSRQQFAARGSFWIDAAGTVLGSELRTPEPILGTLKVRYAPHPTLRLWLPETMEETYRIRLSPRFLTEVNGRASYANARQFKVDASISIK